MTFKVKTRFKTALLAACSVFLLLGHHNNAEAAKDIEVLPANTGTGVTLQININQPTFVIGDRASFSFVASRAGYVSLWDIGTSGKVQRIFPNSYSGNGKVQANVSYGAGGANSSYEFAVNGPAGMEDVYMLWTETLRGQPTQQEYKNAGGFSKDLTVVEREPRNNWATAKVTFEIIQSAHTAAAPAIVPPSTTVNVNGNVYILAMGANVNPLSKTNVDAQNFTRSMRELFNVPDSNIRLINNARVRDFQQSMQWLQSSVKGSNDIVLIFFSGHGSTIADDNGDENGGPDEIFVMYDVEEATYPTAKDVVRDDQFAAWLAAINTDNIITFIDACHSGGLRKSLTNGKTKFLVKGALGQVYKSKGNGTVVDNSGKGLVYAASQENESALEAPQGGLFISTYLQILKDGGHRNLEEVFQDTRRAVAEASSDQQHPAQSGPASIGAGLTIR